MEILDTALAGVHLIRLLSFKDARGEFVKTIHNETFIANNMSGIFSESFYSVSNKNVLRGMHFQYPPNDHDKLVHVVTGSILDVVLDIRHGSPTFGKYLAFELSQNERMAVYIPKGLAHGFLSLRDDTVVEYHTTTSQHKESEGGVKWDSFGFDWPVKNPVLSDRDQNFDSFDLGRKYI